MLARLDRPSYVYTHLGSDLYLAAAVAMGFVLVGKAAYIPYSLFTGLPRFERLSMMQSQAGWRQLIAPKCTVTSLCMDTLDGKTMHLVASHCILTVVVPPNKDNLI